MGEFAEAAERVVTASDEASTTPDVSVDTPSIPDETPAPASPEPAPSVPAEASADLSEGRRGVDGRFTRQSAASKRYQELANQNRTYKTENERLKQVEQAFGWLKPDHAPVIKSFYERFQLDPARALAVELRQIAQSPQHYALLKQELADLFVEQAKTEATAAEDTEPPPDYETEDGEAVYSAKQQAKWMAWRERQLEAKFQKDLEPLKALAQETQQQRVYARLVQQAQEHAKSVVGPLSANPLFVQHKAQIREQYRAIVQQAKAQGREIDGEIALYRAYTQVLQTAATQQSSVGARTLASSLQAKPGASALNPARPVASAAAPRPTTFGEAAAKVLGVR